MGYFISDVDYYLPKSVRSNAFLKEECGIDEKFLEKKIGITSRHIAAPNEFASDMAVSAANKLLEKNPSLRQSIDTLILCTQNPDYRLPTTACIVQEKLGLTTTCMALDINLGCSGFVYALALAGGLLTTCRSGKALIITSEQYCKVVNPKDKNTAAIFGDAAAAAIIERCNDGVGLIDYDFGTDGSGANGLILKNSGVARDNDSDGFLYMNGREVFDFAMQRVPQSVNLLMQRNNIDVDSVDFFVFHQANEFMLKELRRKLNVDEDKFIIDMKDYGNTVSSTIPIVWKNLLARGRVKSGTKVIFCGFGVGLSWGTSFYCVP